MFNHLPGKTAWFTVWTNGKQNSGLVNLALESHLPFVQISSIQQKMAAKAENWCQTWLFGEMEHKFLFGTFHWEIRDYLFDVSSLLEISAGMAQTVMFYLLSYWISVKRFVKYGKQIIHFPLFYPTLKVKALACKSGTIFKMQSNPL